MSEYTAMTKTAKGGTEPVTLRARDQHDAIKRLLDPGYTSVLWVI